jgi:hypothetical protein
MYTLMVGGSEGKTPYRRRIILKLVTERKDGRLWTGYTRTRTGTIGSCFEHGNVS